MDLSVHRTILFLALHRLKQRINPAKLPFAVDEMMNRLFYPLWLGNWLTDMNQASAFFDVLEGKYRDPCTRWKTADTYDFSKSIAQYQNEWTRMFRALWKTECASISTMYQLNQIALPAGLTIENAHTIGGYYPYDHFDVADRMRPLCPTCNKPMTMLDDRSAWRHEGCPTSLIVGNEGDVDWESVPDREEYEHAVNSLSFTAHRGVFNECLDGPLAYALAGNDRTDYRSLRFLGKALHILQDFFAHSNFVELLLLAGAERGGLLPDELKTALKDDHAGPFASFLQYGPTQEMTVVTGRFDQVDTVASILRLYRENIVTRWQDLRTGGFQGQKGKTRDLMVEVLFGTFSNLPFVPQALATVKKTLAVSDFLSSVKQRVKNGVISFFAMVAKTLADKKAEENIDRVQGLLRAANAVEARDYATAGRIMYVERTIEQKLQDDLAASRKAKDYRVLPHHTLLALDEDVSQPECRLAFKIACLMAVDVTEKVLEQYLTGGNRSEIRNVLAERYRHPSTLLADQTTSHRLQNIVPQIYGSRWWMVGSDGNNTILG